MAELIARRSEIIAFESRSATRRRLVGRLSSALYAHSCVTRLHLFSYLAENTAVFRLRGVTAIRTRLADPRAGLEQEAVTLCLCREGPARGGIVVLVYGPLNLAAPYLRSYAM